jgi:hypothetical protein
MTPPNPGTFARMARNMFRGPGREAWDLSLLKDWKPAERVKIQFRAEFFKCTQPAKLCEPLRSELHVRTSGSFESGAIWLLVRDARRARCQSCDWHCWSAKYPVGNEGDLLAAREHSGGRISQANRKTDSKISLRNDEERASSSSFAAPQRKSQGLYRNEPLREFTLLPDRRARDSSGRVGA